MEFRNSFDSAFGVVKYDFTESNFLDYQVTEIAHRQIAERLNIPFKYYERMRIDFLMLLDKKFFRYIL